MLPYVVMPAARLECKSQGPKGRKRARFQQVTGGVGPVLGIGPSLAWPVR